MIKNTNLPNGIKIISEYMPESYSATVMVWVNAGPNVESDELNGISHFIEHMVFKGTEKRTSKEIAQTIENSGGIINAFTDKEATCFYAKVLDDQVPVAIDILLDMIFNSSFKNEDIELERQVILEEIKMYEDTPDELVHDLLMKSFWNGHPLGQPVTGTTESILRISRDNILDFVNDYYTPDNIIISIAGKFDEEAVVNRIIDIAGQINSVSKIKELSAPSVTPKVCVYDKDIEQTHICLGARGISILDEDRYAMAIIDVSLGGCMASRLFQEIREKRGLVYSINTYEALYRHAGIFGIYSGTNPANVQEVIDLIMHEIEKLKLNGISDDELEKAKSQLKGGLLIGLESTKYRAGRNARSELYFNRQFTTDEICTAIDRVSHSDINRLSNYIFDSNYMGIYLVGPEKSAPKELSLSC